MIGQIVDGTLNETDLSIIFEILVFDVLFCLLEKNIALIEIHPSLVSIIRSAFCNKIKSRKSAHTNTDLLGVLMPSVKMR